jgi:hypothetical protein
MSMKNPLTPAGIETATFRFVAQHLNHCATAIPRHFLVPIEFRAGRPKNGSKTFYKVTDVRLPTIEPRYLRLPACSLVTIPTELFRNGCFVFSWSIALSRDALAVESIPCGKAAAVGARK